MTISRKTIRNVFLGVVGCIVLYWLLFDADRVKGIIGFVKGIFAPFVVGAGIAFVINVPMRFLENKLLRFDKPGLRRAIAILLTFSVFSLIIFLIVQLLVPQLTDTVETLLAKMPGFVNGIREKIEHWLADNPEALEWVLANTDFENIDWMGYVEKILAWVSQRVSEIVGGAFAAIGNVFSELFNGVISFVFALYCLSRKEILGRQGKKLIYAFLPEKFCDEAVRILRLTGNTIANFISGQCLEALILGSMFAVAMLIFRMPYVPLVSVLIAITALVPIVGAFVGCGLGAFFILVDDPIKALWFVVMFLILQQIEGNLIYPRVVGKSVGLPGMWVLLAVSVGGSLMGVAGMFIMIPLVSVAYTLLREITDKRLESRGITAEKINEVPQQEEPEPPAPKKKKEKKSKKKA